jgi:hypothetical protein
MPRAIRNNEEKSQTKQKKKKKSGSRSFVRVSDGLFLAFGQKYDPDGESLEKIKRESPPTTTTTTTNDTHGLVGRCILETPKNIGR